MNKKISLGVTISIVAITAAITFILTFSFSLQNFNDKVKDVVQKAEKYETLNEIDTLIREKYYGDIDENELMDSILSGYVAGIDDNYARYYTAEEFQEVEDSDSGIRVGIGVTVVQDESGYIKIIEISNDSPLVDSGVSIDDLIVAVDGVDVLEAGYSESVDAVKGTVGTDVTITVRRDGIDTDYTFTRKELEIITAEGKMLDNNIGYVKITGFNTTTPTQFNNALKELYDSGAESFVFDVRDNGGGLVSGCEGCLDTLLPVGEIAFATYKDGSKETICYSDNDPVYTDIPMIVLVNENTASAAELFAASLRDFDVAELVGVQTFGKGIMQSTFKLDDGGAVKITVATYQTVKSDCYHGIGLTPDYEVEMTSGETQQEGTEYEDTQLNKAIELLGGK